MPLKMYQRPESTMTFGVRQFHMLQVGEHFIFSPNDMGLGPLSKAWLLRKTGDDEAIILSSGEPVKIPTSRGVIEIVGL
jgi:hypothetical protein